MLRAFFGLSIYHNPGISMNRPVISVEHLTKRYQLGVINSGTLAKDLNRWWARWRGKPDPYVKIGQEDLSQRRGDSILALDDVSFSVNQGEALGVIGKNGAGKSTLLKILSQVTAPTSGVVKVKGRIGSLLEVGTGFHPELTGRENIFLNGAILGLKRQEIQRKLDEIIAFSELERFIDTPVKRYSSGMYVRLGFAVAAHVGPDVLLVDEVLAVGDSSFRHRCIRHMRGLQNDGTTVIFVSHNMHLIRSMCNSALLLTNGRIHAAGSTTTVISAYEQWLTEAPTEAVDQAFPSDPQDGLILTLVEIAQPDVVSSTDRLDSRRPFTMRIHYHATQPQRVGRIDVRILREDSTLCCTADSSQSVTGALHDLVGEGTIVLTYAPAQLTTGTYTATIRITDISDSTIVASAQSAPFRVYAEGAGQDRGVYVPKVTWSRTP